MTRTIFSFPLNLDLMDVSYGCGGGGFSGGGGGRHNVILHGGVEGGRDGVQRGHQVHGTLKTRPLRIQDESGVHTGEVVLLKHQVHGTLKTRPHMYKMREMYLKT